MTYQPSPIDLIRELREVLGLFSGAMPESPSEVWQETLVEVQKLMRDAGRPCVAAAPDSMFTPKRCHCRPDLPTYHVTTAA